MHDPGRVRRRHSRGHLVGDIKHSSELHPCAARQRHAKRLTVDELGGNEMRRARLSDLINGEDVRVIKG